MGAHQTTTDTPLAIPTGSPAQSPFRKSPSEYPDGVPHAPQSPTVPGTPTRAAYAVVSTPVFEPTNHHTPHCTTVRTRKS